MDNEDDSLKLDLSESMKNPFEEGKDDVDQESFNSKIFESENDAQNDVNFEIITEDAKKNTMNQNKSSKIRKRWVTNQSNKLVKTKSKNFGSDATGDDNDSSFLSDFAELENTKPVKNKDLE